MPPTTPSSTTTDIQLLLAQYATALRTRSVPAALALYTPDGVFMAPGQPAAVGTEALTRAYERVFGGGRLEVEFEVKDVVVMGSEGEWAVARTEARGRKVLLRMKSEAEGGEEEVGEVTAENQELFVLRKVEGEGWRIARYAFSSMRG
jgi:uncharacterized protein (TIGR02246 family)